MTEPYETLAKICSLFFFLPSTRLSYSGVFLSHGPTSVCNGGLKSNVNICVCAASTMGFCKHLRVDATDPLVSVLPACLRLMPRTGWWQMCRSLDRVSSNIYWSLKEISATWKNPSLAPSWKAGLRIWRGQAPVAGGLSPPFLRNPNISKPLHMHPGHVPPCSTAGLLDTEPGTCDRG